ncbi:MAG: LON peptidase substrate-binding domain-containing protein, partial [Thermomicrobiales bacterium]
EWLPEPVADARALRDQAARRWHAFRRQIATMTDAEQTDDALPVDPTDASYALAALLPVNNSEKQRLLEATDSASRLRETLRLINREHGLLRYLSEPHAAARWPDDDSAVGPN